MNNFMKKHKLLAKSKKFLALLLAVATVIGTVPASTVSAAELSATETEDVSIVPANDSEAAADTTAEGTGDGVDSGLIKYSLDTSVFEENLKDEGFSTVEEYGSEAVSSWTNNWMVPQNVYVLKDGVRLCTLSQLKDQTGLEYTTKWQVKKGDKFEDLEAAPTYTSPVGVYQLLVEIPAVAEVSDAMSAPITFEITKAEMELGVNFDDVEPGTLVKDVKPSSLSASHYVYNEGTTTFSMTGDDNSQLSYTLTITDAYTGEALAADTALLLTGDYYVKVVPTFTDKVTAEEQAKYTLPVYEKKLQMAGLIDTELYILVNNKWLNDNGTPDNPDDDYHKFTETFDGEDVTGLVEGVDYTVAVRYWDHFDYEKNEDVWVTIPVEEGDITTGWVDYNTGVISDVAPVDAGTYYYVISYAGKAGLYQSAVEYLEFVVEPMELTLVPKWKGDTAPTLYPGMSEADVLDYVDYDAVDASGAVVDIDRDHIFGTYWASSRTFPYEPVFNVQVGKTEGETTTYTNLNGRLLQYPGDYRVVFSGDKAVYYLDGGSSRSRDINSTDGYADQNYIVNVEAETLNAKVLSVTVSQGAAATIDVTALLQNGAGATYENAITGTYDGEDLYAERAEYKVAKVVETANTSNEVASGTDDTLTYTWYYQSGTEVVEDKEVPVWTEAFYRNSPSDAGAYKLEVTYADPANYYHAAPAAVYFVIEPQKIKVVPKVVPNALTETAVDDYDKYDIEYEIQTVEGEVLDWQRNDEYYMSINRAWVIEEAPAGTLDGEDAWVEAEGDFSKDKQYRVGVEGNSRYFYPYSDNYVDYEVVTEGTGDDATTKTVYFHEWVTLTADVMGSTELVITPDATKLKTDTKVYDGERWNLDADIENGLIKVTKKADGAAVTDVELDYRWYCVDDGDDSSVAPYEAGKYILYASFAGDTTYHSVDEVEVATITITKKDLNVTPGVDEVVVAGTYASNAVNFETTTFEGVVARDESYFQYQYFLSDYYGYYINGFPAVNGSYSTTVRDADNNRYYGNCQAGETYTLAISFNLIEDLARNYNLKFKEVTFTPVRGNSTVYASSVFSNVSSIALTDTVTGMDHVVKPTQAIPYSYYVNGENLYGYYMAIAIQHPAEYASVDYDVHEDASYESSIMAAGAVDVYSDSDNIYALFDVSAKDTKSFSVSWEPGYVENFTVDFSKATLLANLAEAVDAKSISLISPAKKMAVGGTQQLDVKLTKKQMNDVIALGYSVDNADVLCVDEYGYVTALKPGKATVTVYSARYDYTIGKMVAIEGAKTAKVAITVSDVSAAKVKKITAWDIDASVLYAPVKDGYRREGYVLEGKNVSVETFESTIAAMEGQHWEAFFAAAPDYSTSSNSYLYFSGLKPNTDYTVYVRNVAATRNLEDGCKVVASAKGSTKSFKTTKSQVKQLFTYYDEKQPVTYNAELGRNEVKLTSKKLTVSAYGYFLEKAMNAAAEDVNNDGVYDAYLATLPLSKDLKNTYLAPKLTYYVATRTSYEPSSYYYYDEDNGWYYTATSLATINKSGKMTLKGAGVVYVAVQDTISGVMSSFQPLYITANPDKITANKVNLQVGQSMSLTSMVTYYEGKTKLSGTFDRYIMVTDELRKAFADSEHFVLDGDNVIAVKAGGTLSNLTLTDAYCGASTTASIKSAAMPAISSLKATSIVDKYAKMSFVHAGYANKFRIEVLDERGRLCSSEVVSSNSLYVKTEKGKKHYAFTIDGLTRQSKYTVQVTAIYEGADGVYVEAKTVKKAVKTTKMPASYKALGKYDYNMGIDIYVTSKTMGTQIQNTYFVTGNTYTLIAAGEGESLSEGAKVSVSDTLTWTSTNKKVASIKGNAGTYTATLKALRSGYTTIEVKSKITKQVIARYEIYVYAVGDAAYVYFGENEPLKGADIGIIPTVDASEVGRYEFVGGANGVYITFTAPSDGYYTFQTVGEYDTYGVLYSYPDGYQLLSNDSGSGDAADNFKMGYSMDEDETVVVYVEEYWNEDFETTLLITKTL